MTTYNWTTLVNGGTIPVSGDWNTAADWISAAVPATAPDDTNADVIIDSSTALTSLYTVKIAAGESVTVHSLTMNDTQADLSGTNNRQGYYAAQLTLDGTLAFAPGSPGLFGGSPQTRIEVDPGDNAEIVNSGTINGYIQAEGDLLLTGTNAVYFTNDIQSLGTVTVDTSSIGEIKGAVLFDGSFEASGAGAAMNLGGKLGGLVVNIGTIEGVTGQAGYTNLSFTGQGSEINEWNGTAYVSVETSLTEIAGGGVVDLLGGRDYTTTNTLTIKAGTGGANDGQLQVEGGTVTTAAIINAGGLVQGFGTIVGGLQNNGTVMVIGGTLDLSGGLTGTGVVDFDYDLLAGVPSATGSTLEVNSVSSGQTIVMDGRDTLQLDVPAAFAGTIEAAIGDKIALKGMTATSAVLTNGALVVSNGTTVVDTLTLSGSYAGDAFAASGSTVTITAAVTPPVVVNNTDGTSYLYTYSPSSTAAETIASYSGLNNTGSIVADIVDNTDGTCLVYAYNPTATVKQTTQNWSATNIANGAPAGSLLADVVDNTDGTCLVYAYNPTATVKQTTQSWSATNAANGAPAGTLLADVVDNTDGTCLVYAYNPTATVTQTTQNWSATNVANGAPAGTLLADVVDNTDGTSIVYAYNPASGVAQTATYYSSYNAANGAPTGTVTGVTFDYTNGESAITTYNGSGAGSTIDYSGPDGTGSVIPSITQATGGAVLSAAVVAPSSDVITITGSGQLIDPGTGSHAIQFISGAANDTLVLHLGGSDQITGFDPAAGDVLDLKSLLSEAGVSLGSDLSQLANYVSVADVNGSAEVLFDPTGHGGGSQVALLANDGGLVAQLQTLKAFQA
jgi:hypothetical protein